MEYQESIDQSAEVVRLVLPALARLQLPANPVNFALWYEYYLGANEPLTKILDQVMAGEQELAPELAQKLYHDHVLNGKSDQLRKIGEEIRELLTSIIGLVGNAGVDVDKFAGSLGQYSDDLDRLKNENAAMELRTMVKEMLVEARDMTRSNRRFSEQLDTTSREIGLLRSELQDLRIKASQDALTGLGNRKSFDDALRRALENASDEMSSVCLMMVDVDHFKTINDEYGHLIGDKILRFIADILRQSVKGRDLVARFGGDEFGIVLEETPPTGAYRLAENIRQLISRSTLKRTDTGESIRRVTVSIGVDCNEPYDTADDILGRADKALYESKNLGRNRVTCTMKRPNLG
jgi:diguanylate cyclase